MMTFARTSIPQRVVAGIAGATLVIAQGKHIDVGAASPGGALT